MSWVLILVTWSAAITSIPFDTQATCEAAKVKMESFERVRIAECFKK